MTIASFDDLCAGFCEIAKVPAPALQADAQGLIAFDVNLRDRAAADPAPAMLVGFA